MFEAFFTNYHGLFTGLVVVLIRARLFMNTLILIQQQKCGLTQLYCLLIQVILRSAVINRKYCGLYMPHRSLQS